MTLYANGEASPYMLLNLDLLELYELRSTSLQVETSTSFVHATIIGGTVGDGHKAQGIDWLVSLRATSIASVGRNCHHRFHFCASRDDSSDSHQLPNVLSLDIPDGNGNCVARSLETHLKSPHEFRWELIPDIAMILRIPRASLHQ